MRIIFFNFDSESHIAPDELTITGWTVDGAQFTQYVTNADLDANGGYTISAPGGALIEKLAFDSGSQSSFKLGVGSISSIRYDVDFDMQLNYSITDINGDSDSGTVNISLDGNNALIGTVGDDVLIGGSGNDTLNGGDGDDTILGGAGDDTLTGGIGADTFKWALGDHGTAGSPALDSITDFDTTSNSDKLNLRDLLQGENHITGSGNLLQYLHFEKIGTDTVLHVSSTGNLVANEDQRITLTSVDLTTIGTDQAIIQDLLNKGKLIVD